MTATTRRSTDTSVLFRLKWVRFPFLLVVNDLRRLDLRQDEQHNADNDGPDDDINNQGHHVDAPREVLRRQDETEQPRERIAVVFRAQQRSGHVRKQTCQEGDHHASHQGEYRNFRCVQDLSPAITELDPGIRCFILEQAVQNNRTGVVCMCYQERERWVIG